jgi:hypothetical protein
MGIFRIGVIASEKITGYFLILLSWAGKKAKMSY